MRTRPGNAARKSAITILSIAGSSFLALVFKPVPHEQAQLLPFTLAVIVTPRFGGLFAGLVATVASFVIADFLLIEPTGRVVTVYPRLRRLVGA